MKTGQLTLLVWPLLAAAAACAQTSTPAAAASSPATAHPAPQLFSGCVTPVPNVENAHVLAVGDRCLLLSGSYKPAQVVGHEVILRGTFIDAAGMSPTTLNVESTRSVGKACTQTCTLVPPGTRGVHGNEKHGHEGGTAGITSSKPPE